MGDFKVYYNMFNVQANQGIQSHHHDVETRNNIKNMKTFFLLFKQGSFWRGAQLSIQCLPEQKQRCTLINSKNLWHLKKKHLKMKFFSNFLKDFSFFHQRIALKYLQKMLFIWSKNLFLFSRYSNLCISVFPFFPLSLIMSSIV